MAFENLIIRARSVTKSYEKETVLSDFNLDVWNGSIVERKTKAAPANNPL